MASSQTSLPTPGQEKSHDVEVDTAMEKRVWRKMDLWILPVVAMFYLLSFIDRTNFGNARVAGLQKDLKMTDRQYSIALTVTYVPYIVAELPSNLLLKTVGPNLMLPTMLTLWGVVTTCQGVVHNYHGLLACRFFLGLLEGGVFPGLVLYLSFFYPRKRLQWRISAFFSTASLSGAFSGLLAFGIINMDGLRSRPGWAWIFILEGIFTVVFGLCSYALLPGSPAQARFLTEGEKAYVVRVLREGGATGKDDAMDMVSMREVKKAFTSPHVVMLAIIFFFNGTLLYGMAYFTPSIVQGLGYTASRAQLMSVPPFATAFVLTMVTAYISDRYRCRGLISIFASLLCIIGFAMFLASEKHNILYASLFFSIPGIYLAAPTLSAWNANNSAPYARRATAIAIGFIMTNSGGILATWLLGTLSPPPRYTKASIVMLVFGCGMAVVSAMCVGWLARENRRKSVARLASSVEGEKEGLGDRSAWFEYIL